MIAQQTIKLCLFELAGVRYGLPAAQVQEFVRMVAVTPLPCAPAVISGFINVRSELIAVVNLRQRFGLALQAAKLSDFLLIASTANRKVALWVDNALGVTQLNIKQITPPDSLTAHTAFLSGVIEAEDASGNQLILVQDLATLLSDAELQSIQQAFTALAP